MILKVLKVAFSKLCKKNDLEIIVTSFVTKLFNDMKKEIDEKIREKTNKHTKAIEELRTENEQFRELVANQSKVIRELEQKSEANSFIAKEALSMSNYNEQYSRKFNIKIMNLPETNDENIKDIFLNKITKEKLKVTVKPEEIQAIHRIPGKNREHRPVLVKLINSEVKYRVMKEKKNLSPECTFKLVDDETEQQYGLDQ